MASLGYSASLAFGMHIGVAHGSPTAFLFAKTGSPPCKNGWVL